MQIERNQLMEDLIARIKRANFNVTKLKGLSLEQLNTRSQQNSWTILECIEHLNRYGDFYLPEIERQLIHGISDEGAELFKPGIIGNYFVGMIQVKKGKVKKMKTPKEMDPIHSDLTITTIDRFLKQQDRLSALLQQAKRMDLTKTKTAISLTKMIKLRLGDTLRFVVYHIERHIAQAEGYASLHAKKHSYESNMI